jgi:hypothetical protein
MVIDLFASQAKRTDASAKPPVIAAVAFTADLAVEEVITLVSTRDRMPPNRYGRLDEHGYTAFGACWIKRKIGGLGLLHQRSVGDRTGGTPRKSEATTITASMAKAIGTAIEALQ